jgi:hypothetical protein
MIIETSITFFYLISSVDNNLQYNLFVKWHRKKSQWNKLLMNSEYNNLFNKIDKLTTFIN